VTTSKQRNSAVITLLLGLIVMIGMFFFLKSHERTFLNFLTLIGTYLSVLGLILAYMQIKSIRETAEETNRAVNLSLTRINQVLSVSDLSRFGKVIQEIQTSLMHEKHELALLRMKDLKLILIQVKFNQDLVEYTFRDIYNQNITDLGNDINNLHDQITGMKKGINFSKLNKNLENLATTLSELENQLKYKQT